MSAPAKTATIYERMAWLMANLPIVKKEHIRTGDSGSFDAFTIDSIYREFHPKFAEAGVFVMPHVDEIEYVPGVSSKQKAFTDVHLIVTYTFYAPDGTSVAMRCPGQSRDYQDRGTNQAVQQAIKYGLVQAFLQPTGEPDADRTDIEAAAKPKQPEVKLPRDEAWEHTYHVCGDDMAKASEMFKAALDALGDRNVDTPQARDSVIALVDRMIKETASDAPE